MNRKNHQKYLFRVWKTIFEWLQYVLKKGRMHRRTEKVGMMRKSYL